MAHPDHDQVIGRLVGARLRGAADRRDVSGGAAEVHPDAEAWAAYVDGGLQADEVVRLETHLAGCRACRRLLVVLAPEVSSDAAPAVRDVEAPAADRGVVIPFPRRQVFAWMAAAAGVFMAVTLWSVSRLGSDREVASVALSTPQRGAAAPAEPAPQAPAPASRLGDAEALDQAARTPAVGEYDAARLEQDKRKPDARSDAPALRSPAEAGGGAAGGGFAQVAKTTEEKQSLQATTDKLAGGRDVQLQSNAAATSARPRGPLANQQANQQAAATQQAANQQPTFRAAPPPASPPEPAPPVAATAPPAVAGATAASPPAAAPVPPPAQTEAAAADARERRANEQPPAELSESVTITSSRTGARRASSPPERAQAKSAAREGQAKSKDEAAMPAALGNTATTSASALLSFAEPGGRLRWRIADGRRLESSSDGGNKWTEKYTARDRLRAGTAPAIDSAWAVGEGGLVLRFVVPGGWAEVARPAPATLVAVSATSSRAARVTADDGRVFETADGGATWTPATPGAGPQ